MRHGHLSMFSWANASLNLANLLFITMQLQYSIHRQITIDPTYCGAQLNLLLYIVSKCSVSQNLKMSTYMRTIQPCPLMPCLMLVTMKIYLMETQHHNLFARYVQLVQYKSPLTGHGLYFFPSGCSTIAAPPQQSVEPGLRFTMQI